MPEPRLQTDWNNEYNFWHAIISEEVERLRFNEGFEPIRVDLYPLETQHDPILVGKTQIGHTKFKARACWTYDKEGKKLLRVEVLKD
jgi:hypothetical protein